MLCRHLSAHKLSATEEQPSQRERGTEHCVKEREGARERERERGGKRGRDRKRERKRRGREIWGREGRRRVTRKREMWGSER